MKILILLFFLLSATGWGQDLEIGAVYNTTGSQSALDLPSYRGAMLAAKLADVPVTLRLAAGHSVAETTAQKTESLLDSHPGLCALVGLSDTDQVLAAAKVASEHEVPFVTSGATSPLLPAEVPEHLFLACFGDNVQAAAGAEYAYQDLKARTAVVIYDDRMEYTRLLQDYFCLRFEQLGGTIAERRVFSEGNLSTGDADLVFLAVGPQEALKGARLLRENGVKVPILGGDSFDSGVWQGEDVSGVYYSTHAYLGEDNPSPLVQRFRAAYLKAYGEEPDAFSGLGFDAVNLVIRAAEIAQSARPDAVLKALARTNDFQGVTGLISYPDGSRIPAKSVTIMRVTKGEQAFEKEWMPAEVPEPSTLRAPGATLEKLSSDFLFAEGLTRAPDGSVYFTDQPNNRIMQWTVDGRLETFMQPAGRANGMHFDGRGNLLACADEKNELWSISPDKEVTVILSQFKGNPLNGPNDLWVHPDGSLYFTDPYYQRDWWSHQRPPQPTQQVYRVSPERTEVTRVTRDLVKPNGIVGTPDGTFLYVADIEANRTHRYRIATDGSLTAKTLFCELGSDGMTLDNEGNLYLTGNGVTVFSPEGRRIDHIAVPEKWTGNICFGGTDAKTLFIAASRGLYALPMRVRGANAAK